MENFFFYLGCISTALFVILLFLTLIGAHGSDVSGHDISHIHFGHGHFGAGHSATGHGHSHSTSDGTFRILSLQSILAFLMSFSWVSLSLLKHSLNETVAIGLAVLVGIGMMFFAAGLLWGIKKLEYIPSFDLNSVVGTTGTAYTRINGADGQVEVLINNTKETFDAFTKGPDIASFSPVRIVSVTDTGKFEVAPVQQ